MSYTGILFDIADETILERCPVERATEDEAYADAEAMAKALGYDESYCFIYDENLRAVCYD